MKYWFQNSTEIARKISETKPGSAATKNNRFTSLKLLQQIPMSNPAWRVPIKVLTNHKSGKRLRK